MGIVFSLEAQNVISFGGQRSMDYYGSKHYINKDVKKIIYQVGSEGTKQNMIVCLRFSIVECIWESYGKDLLGQSRDFVPI